MVVFDLWPRAMAAFCFWFFVRGLLKPRHGKRLDEIFLSAGFFLLGITVGSIGYNLPRMAGVWLILMILYVATWQEGLFLAVSYFAVQELVRFTIYHAFTGLSKWLVDRQADRFLADEYTLAQFEQRLNLIGQGYAFVFFVTFIVLLFLFLYCYKKQLPDRFGYGKKDKTKLLYLMVPALTGFVYCALMRSIQFVWEEEKVWILDEQFPIVRFLVPAGSLLCLGVIFLAALLLKRMETAMAKQQENDIYRNRLHDMELYIRDMERVYGDVRSMRHDLKNYVADMQILAKSGKEADKAAFDEYLQAVSERVEALDFTYQTGNPITDVVVNRQLANAARKGIMADCAFVFPQKDSVEAFDISIMLNNALENAVEACPPGGSISLTSRRQGKLFLISVKNTCENEICFENGIPVSTKTGELHGQGTLNIKKIAEKYGGTVDFHMEERLFVAEMLLQVG